MSDRKSFISRRTFLTASSTAAAGAAVTVCATPVVQAGKKALKKVVAKKKIGRFRTLGRTGFKVSDISLGGLFSDSSVVRYVLDAGINFIDTAESYGNGDAENMIGDALKHVERKGVFIATKMLLKGEETEQNILDRYAKCLKRLKTPYVDALYMHSLARSNQVGMEAFHKAFARLKADGKVRFKGISNHGAQGQDDDSMEKVLLAAVDDGRFDLMLLTYNFMNKKAAEQVLAACKKKNIGTTAMKTAPGRLEIEKLDPENLSQRQTLYLEYFMKEGATRKKALKKMAEMIQRGNKEIEKNKPLVDAFMKEHGVSTQEEVRFKSIQWVLSNPDMHTVCLSMRDFDAVNKHLPLSGSDLSRKAQNFLDKYLELFSSQHCRHGCIDCIQACPKNMPVSRIMRYAYYFNSQGKEKLAMEKYAKLGKCDASACLGCQAHCAGACPHGLDVQAHLTQAHSLLSLA
jgi:predicted aldo/keto reductase-like oxidoreductase